jgi:type I restriction-modification system DNA methylase subunit
VFTDWLDLMLYSLQGRDDPYMEIVDQYDADRPKGDRAPDLYARAFGQLQQGMSETQADLLGVIYETMGHETDAFGQYFTPHNVSEMKAELVLGADDTDKDGDVDSIADPACGSGRLLVSAAKRQPAALYYGADKDGTCARMTALNLCFFNVDGYAVHADSLAQDYYAGWQTWSTPLGGDIRELAVDDIPRPTFTTSDDEQAATSDTDAATDVDLDLDGGQTTFDDYQ